MMRHALAEGWLLLRQRAAVSLVLALALAVPISLAGIGLTLYAWLQPMAAHSNETGTVAVLLHPRLDQQQRRQWMDGLGESHPEWVINEVPQDELVLRLSRWFPYLADLLEGRATEMPPLIEIATTEPADVAVLEGSRDVLAIGPLTSIEHILGRVARRLALVIALLSAMVLAGAVLLSGVWVHLELYRHAGEITIMRLVGATEGTLRGPFVVAVAVPGLLAGLLSVVATIVTTKSLSEMTTALGLAGVSPPWVGLALQAAAAVLLPVAAAMVTLARYAADPIEN
jgi:cell division transport system permease protein